MLVELLTYFGASALATSSLGLAIQKRWPARLKATAAPVQFVEPARPKPALEIERVAAAGKSDDTRSRFVVDDEETGRGHWERPARHRTAFVAKEKIMQRFVAWMIDEQYSGWYTPGQVYEAFQEFAFDQRLEEFDKITFLSMLAAEPGVIKRRAYIQKNDTYAHLRQVLKGQERAVVYRIPTAPELAVVLHKRDLKAAEDGRRMAGPKSRPSPAGHKQPRATPVAQKGPEIKEIDVATSRLDVAA